MQRGSSLIPLFLQPKTKAKGTWEYDCVYKMYSFPNICICTEPSLKTLLNELHPVRASWYKIGLQLDIPHATLDCFKQNYSDQTDLMCEMLKEWLKTAVDHLLPGKRLSLP